MLIILEGLPGAGKTTLGKRLARKFGGVLIPQIILPFPKNYKQLASYAKEQFFMKNDLQKYKKARQCLKNKKLVIMDRGIFSTIAYNYALTRLKQSNTYKKVMEFYKKNRKIFNLPQIIVYLNVSILNSLRRKKRLPPKKTEEASLWVNPYFLKEMKNFYHKFLPKFKNRNIHIMAINSIKPLEKAFQEICKKINFYEK